MLDGFMSLLGLPEKLKQFISIVMEAAGKYEEAEKTAALEMIDVTGQEKAEKAIDDAVIVERLAREMSYCAHVIKPDGDIFPKEYRRTFTDEFLRQNPAALPYQNEVEESVSQWFRKMECVLRENYSKGERVILRNEILNHMDMDGFRREMEEAISGLRSAQDFDTPMTSNQNYKDIFEAPLFLHRGNTEVCLRNLFVHHRFKVAKRMMNGRMEMLLSQESMDDCLARFVLDRETRFLFIVGDAGCGKSSLAAYLSWHYERHDQIAKEIFGDNRLITVQLRNIDVPSRGRKEERLKLSILHFLYNDKESDNVLKSRFRKSAPCVLLLDGYDELCTMDGIENPEVVLGRLEELDCKIIVTVRPDYIDFSYFNRLYWHIALEHFNGNQRREWVRHYEACGQVIDKNNRSYLERIRDDETAGICDTPMGLYMVAAGHFTPDMLENERAIYHQIFLMSLVRQSIILCPPKHIAS